VCAGLCTCLVHRHLSGRSSTPRGYPFWELVRGAPRAVLRRGPTWRSSARFAVAVPVCLPHRRQSPCTRVFRPWLRRSAGRASPNNARAVVHCPAPADWCRLRVRRTPSNGARKGDLPSVARLLPSPASCLRVLLLAPSPPQVKYAPFPDCLPLRQSLLCLSAPACMSVMSDASESSCRCL
jgi:hypothetical protein